MYTSHSICCGLHSVDPRRFLQPVQATWTLPGRTEAGLHHGGLQGALSVGRAESPLALEGLFQIVDIHHNYLARQARAGRLPQGRQSRIYLCRLPGLAGPMRAIRRRGLPHTHRGLKRPKVNFRRTPPPAL